MPFPYSITDFVNEIPNVLSDATDLTTAYQPAAVARAILQRYSQDAPLRIVSDIEGNGTNYLPVPVAPGTGNNLPVWESNFSVIERIEYPVGQQPTQYVLDSDITIYSTPGQPDQIMLNFDSPPPGDILRVTWTARHLADGSTVPDKDFYAVVDYAASLCADKLTSYYVGTSDPTISADVVNYRSKSAEMDKVAKMLRRRYYNHMGIKEEQDGTPDKGPALAIGNQFLEQNSGVDRLVHDKYSR